MIGDFDELAILTEHNHSSNMHRIAFNNAAPLNTQPNKLILLHINEKRKTYLLPINMGDPASRLATQPHKIMRSVNQAAGCVHLIYEKNFSLQKMLYLKTVL